MSIANIELLINENLSTDHTISSAEDQPSNQPENDPNVWTTPKKNLTLNIIQITKLSLDIVDRYNVFF